MAPLNWDQVADAIHDWFAFGLTGLGTTPNPLPVIWEGQDVEQPGESFGGLLLRGADVRGHTTEALDYDAARDATDTGLRNRATEDLALSLQLRVITAEDHGALSAGMLLARAKPRLQLADARAFLDAAGVSLSWLGNVIHTPTLVGADFKGSAVLEATLLAQDYAEEFYTWINTVVVARAP